VNSQPEPDDLIEKLDSLVPPVADPENQVLVDQSRIVRWTGPLFALFSVILLPWIIYIALTLPARQESPHYDVAWVGFDMMLFAGLASTAYFALRKSSYLASAATATATLLIVDVWFDVMTSPGRDLVRAILLAVVVELPLASVCVWLSRHTHQLTERRISLLLRRRPRPHRQR
jgi:hypothetical protein